MNNRWVFPDDYSNIYASGALDPEKGIRLSRIGWRTPREICDYKGPDYLSKRLVPFADTSSGDNYGWWKCFDGIGYDYVVFSPHDFEEADVFAPDFICFLYRALLEECRDCWIACQDECDSKTVVTIMNRNLELVATHLPPKWTATLAEIMSHEPISLGRGVISWIAWQNVDEIVHRDIRMAALDTHIIQHIAD